jgi:hypothetical protein
MPSDDWLFVCGKCLAKPPWNGECKTIALPFPEEDPYCAVCAHVLTKSDCNPVLASELPE